MNQLHEPQFNTSFTESFAALEKRFSQDREQISEWLKKQWQLTKPPVYGSVDLRNAGFKVAPIDMNLFPAGFNNINQKYLSLSVKAAGEAIRLFDADAKNILIIPEGHTRNLFYWSNVKTLQSILTQAGFNVRLGRMNGSAEKATQSIQLENGDVLTVELIQRKENQLILEDFLPDLILLNNDLSEGIPDILKNLDQPLIPPAELGWSQRLKSEHFQYYAAVAQEFSDLLQIDPWLIAPLFRHCGRVDFMQQEGLSCLIHHGEELFTAIREKYAAYKVQQQPFLIVKADAGTYGMAVMTVRDIKELHNLNRKQRSKMATTKGGQRVQRVIIQEGVYTAEIIGPQNAVAEPVVYLWGSQVVGGFYRVHGERGADENLNAPGMRFEPIAFSETCHEPCVDQKQNPCQNRFYTYGIIAQLSMLAAAREMKDHKGI